MRMRLYMIVHTKINNFILYNFSACINTVLYNKHEGSICSIQYNYITHAVYNALVYEKIFQKKK